MHKQQGMATLLVTTMVLVVSLLFSLASYKNVFYQIKRAQNETMARKVHWLAEGGLECGFAELRVTGQSPTEPGFANLCSDIERELDVEYKQLTPDRVSVESTAKISSAKKRITKDIEFGAGINSTLKMNASTIELMGSQHFIPNPTTSKAASGNYKCQSVVTSGVVNYVSGPSGEDEHFLTIDSTDSLHGGEALGSVSFACDPAYKSNLFEPSNLPSYLTTAISPVKGKDIVEHQAINVFKDIFGTDLSKWKAVRESFAKHSRGEIIGPSTVHAKGGDAVTATGWIKDCSNIIKQSVEAGNQKIWVDGSCAIGDHAFGAHIDTSSMIIVVFNGFLEFNDVAAFNGLLYQYAPSSIDAKAVWEDRVDNIADPVRGFNKSDIDPTFLNVSFYVRGSTYVDGAIGVDAPGRTVRIYGSIIPSYNAEKVKEHLSGDARWIRGTWRDF